MLKELIGRVLRGGSTPAAAADELTEIRVALGAGRTQEARPRLAGYLRRHPHDPEALHLRGLDELGSGEFDAAAGSIADAVNCDPDNPMYRANLGLALWNQGLLRDARAQLEAALERAPHLVTACVNLARVLTITGEPELARAHVERCLTHAATMAATDQAQLWGALSMLSEYLPAIDNLECLNRACALAPESEILDLLRYRPMAWQCDWRYPADDLAAYFERLADAPELASHGLLAPSLADSVEVSSDARFAAARRTACMIAERVKHLDFRPHRQTRPAGKIRLGYLSADFHDHPTMHLLRGVLAAHDRRHFELHGFSSGPDDGSALRQAARSLLDNFHDIRALNPLETARLIHAQGIDILVDLKGYTGAARTEVMALRPAPVQVSYLGHPGTMGAPFIDYLIADRVLIPPGRERWYSERIVTMPHSYQPNDDAQTIAPAAPSRAEAGLPESAFVFCSFNATYKIDPAIFSVWMEILAGVPNAVLWILAGAPAAGANLRREAGARGVAAERLVFAAALPKARHLARMTLADLFLDTHRVNAHTSASDALWAGVPLITWPGESFTARVGASLLTAVGLPELVCGDAAAYRELAIGLARDPARLAELRARLHRQRRTAPLFATAAYTRHLEAAFMTMHEAASRGDAPAAFCVPRRPAVPLAE